MNLEPLKANGTRQQGPLQAEEEDHRPRQLAQLQLAQLQLAPAPAPQLQLPGGPVDVTTAADAANDLAPVLPILQTVVVGLLGLVSWTIKNTAAELRAELRAAVGVLHGLDTRVTVLEDRAGVKGTGPRAVA